MRWRVRRDEVPIGAVTASLHVAALPRCHRLCPKWTGWQPLAGADRLAALPSFSPAGGPSSLSTRLRCCPLSCRLPAATVANISLYLTIYISYRYLSLHSTLLQHVWLKFSESILRICLSRIRLVSQVNIHENMRPTSQRSAVKSLR